MYENSSGRKKLSARDVLAEMMSEELDPSLPAHESLAIAELRVSLRLAAANDILTGKITEVTHPDTAAMALHYLLEQPDMESGASLDVH